MDKSPNYIQYYSFLLQKTKNSNDNITDFYGYKDCKHQQTGCWKENVVQGFWFETDIVQRHPSG